MPGEIGHDINLAPTWMPFHFSPSHFFLLLFFHRVEHEPAEIRRIIIRDILQQQNLNQVPAIRSGGCNTLLIVSLDDIQPLLFSICLQMLALAMSANGKGYLPADAVCQMNSTSCCRGSECHTKATFLSLCFRTIQFICLTRESHKKSRLYEASDLRLTCESAETISAVGRHNLFNFFF